MSPGPEILKLTDAALGRIYDPGTLERGIAYADEGRCLPLESQPNKLRGTVRGSGQRTYISRVSWVADDRGLQISDHCSCPLGGDCKHCVALVVTVRRKVAGLSGPDRMGWRETFVGLSTDEGNLPGELPLEVTAAPLALAVSMTTPRRARWQGTANKPGLSIRPLRMSKNGRWVKTGASWRDISSQAPKSSHPLDAPQAAVLRAMLASIVGGVYSSDTTGVEFSRFGTDIWFHLRRAVNEGVTLVGPDPIRGPVTLSTLPARVGVDITADPTGAASVAGRVTLGDDHLPFNPETDGILGVPPSGLFVQQDSELQLIPLEDPLHPSLARLLSEPTLRVPAGEVDELLDGYVPALSRVAEVVSSDGSVKIATTEFHELVLTVERTSLLSANLRWAALYRRGDREVRHLLGGYSQAGPESTAEAKSIQGLELPTHFLAGLTGPEGRPRDLAVSGQDTITVLDDVVPWLESKAQVRVEITGDQPELHEAIEDPLISLSIANGETPDNSRTDWFDLAVTVSIDGEQIEFAQILAALTQGEELLILPDGTWIGLDRPEFTKLRELIGEASGLADHEGEGDARINPFQVSWFDELASLGVVDTQSALWASNVERMRNLSSPVALEPPEALAATLRPYQQEGLDWLAFLYRNQLGGILADDMGLGKTVQALALCLHILEEKPEARFLVVAPTSVVENWHHEADAFAPGVDVSTIRESGARRGTGLTEAVGDARIVITSYALFRIEFDSYQQIDWDLMFLDEAQFVKNHRSKTYQCARRLNAPMKVAVTGTPLENSLMDLWSLLSITAPGLYPDPKRFSEVYRKPIESGKAPELLATLRRRIAPLMRRRTKDAVLDDLPPKTEQTIEVEMSPEHARIYQTQLQRQRQKVLGLVGDVTKNRFEILKSLTMLRQLSLDPGLVDEEHDHVGSAKLDRLVDDLTQLIAEGHRALVFSQFTRFLARVRARLDEAGIEHAYLDGRTRQRGEEIASFKDSDMPVFVISLKAGGFGLNLTEADYCFVLDPWWNPAVETQAIDRTHRIGQREAVMVYRYVSTNTIEEKVMELKARKADLFANVLDSEGALSGPLDAGDIRGLLNLSD